MEKASLPGRSWKDYLLRFWHGYNKINEIVSNVILVAITIIVFMGVCARYVFRAPFEWSDEFAIYGFIWLCFLGAGLAEKNNKHFRVTVIVERMGPRVRLVIEILLHILLFFILYQFFFDSIKYFNQGKSGISTIMLIPLSYIYIAMPISVALMFLNRIKVFVDTIIQLTRMIKDPAYAAPAEARQEEVL